MARIELYEPHETRMLALEMAVSLVNADKSKSNHYDVPHVVAIARGFEAYLTEKPIEGYAPDQEKIE